MTTVPQQRRLLLLLGLLLRAPPSPHGGVATAASTDAKTGAVFPARCRLPGAAGQEECLTSITSVEPERRSFPWPLAGQPAPPYAVALYVSLEDVAACLQRASSPGSSLRVRSEAVLRAQQQRKKRHRRPRPQLLRPGWWSSKTRSKEGDAAKDASAVAAAGSTTVCREQPVRGDRRGQGWSLERPWCLLTTVFSVGVAVSRFSGQDLDTAVGP